MGKKPELSDDPIENFKLAHGIVMAAGGELDVTRGMLPVAPPGMVAAVICAYSNPPRLERTVKLSGNRTAKTALMLTGSELALHMSHSIKVPQIVEAYAYIFGKLIIGQSATK